MRELYKLFTSEKVELIRFCKSELGYQRTIQYLKPYSIRFSELEDWLKEDTSLIEVVLKDKTIKRFSKQEIITIKKIEKK